MKNTEPSNLELFYQAFESIMHSMKCSKYDRLHIEGKVCNHLFLIKKGIARAFYYKDGQDITAHFAPEGTMITAIDSFIQRKRSRYNIELLESAEIVSISHKDLHDLLAREPEHEKLVRLYLQDIYVELQQRLEDILFHTAKERYEKLIEKNPNLLQRVNLGYIASYLGVTQETLSRIRNIP